MTDSKPKTALDNLCSMWRHVSAGVRESLDQCDNPHTIGSVEGYNAGRKWCAYDLEVMRPIIENEIRATVLESVADQMACRSSDAPLTAAELRAEAKRLRGEK